MVHGRTFDVLLLLRAIIPQTVVLSLLTRVSPGFPLCYGWLMKMKIQETWTVSPIGSFSQNQWIRLLERMCESATKTDFSNKHLLRVTQWWVPKPRALAPDSEYVLWSWLAQTSKTQGHHHLISLVCKFLFIFRRGVAFWIILSRKKHLPQVLEAGTSLAMQPSQEGEVRMSGEVLLEWIWAEDISAIWVFRMVPSVFLKFCLIFRALESQQSYSSCSGADVERERQKGLLTLQLNNQRAAVVFFR